MSRPIVINELIEDEKIKEYINENIKDTTDRKDLERFIINILAYGYTIGAKNQRELGNHEIRIKKD